MRKNEYTELNEVLYSDVLPNGLTLLVLPKPGYRKCFAAFAADYGGADRRFTLGGELRDTPAGIAHYLEHKMFDMPYGSALTKLEANGASPNAFTCDTMTLYHFECTSAFEENLRELLSFVSTPYFTTESVEKERGIIGQEIRMCEDDPDYRIYMNLMRALFSVGPLRDSVAGTVESIAEITADTLYDLHSVFYHPCNMSLAVVGDVDPETVRRIALEVLTPESAEKPRPDYGESDGDKPCQSRVEERMEVSMPQFCAGIKIGTEPVGREALWTKVAGGLILGTLFGHASPVYTRLYEQGLLNSDFSVSLEMAAGRAFLVFGGESKDPDTVVEALKAELTKACDQGLDHEFFERRKKASYGSRVRSLGNFENMAVSMAEGVFGGYSPLDAVELLRSVTVEEANTWLKEKVNPEYMAVSLLLPLSDS